MNENRIRRLFRISLLLKGADGVLECLGGLALAFVSTATVVTLIDRLVQNELIEDPHDFLATALLRFAENFSVSSQHFFAFYLFGHGLVKVGLVAGLLRDKLWAFPLALVVLALFVAWQLWRVAHTLSPGLLVLTGFDLIVMVLIWHEWGARHRERLTSA